VPTRSRPPGTVRLWGEATSYAWIDELWGCDHSARTDNPVTAPSCSACFPCRIARFWLWGAAGPWVVVADTVRAENAFWANQKSSVMKRKRQRKQWAEIAAERAKQIIGQDYTVDSQLCMGHATRNAGGGEQRCNSKTRPAKGELGDAGTVTRTTGLINNQCAI
jgi:hypothetical protein